MIEDIMNITTKIVNQFQSSWTKTELFVLHTVKDNQTDYVQMEAINHSHTTLFKIRAKQSDLGLIFKHPCIYETENAILRKWKLTRMNFDNIRDECYWNMLKFDDVFDIEYDSFDYQDLRKLLLTWDTDMIEVYNNGCRGVYSTELLRSLIIEEVEDISLKLLFDDAPLRLNYKVGIFDVYCLVAPRLEVKSPYWLKV